MNMVTLTMLMGKLKPTDSGFHRRPHNVALQADRDYLKESLFQATVLRCATTAGYYVLFNRWMNLDNVTADTMTDADLSYMCQPITDEDKVRLPTMSESDAFVNFLSFCSEDGLTGSMAKFTKVLHEAALLDATKSTVENFGSFLRGYKRMLNDFFDKGNTPFIPRCMDPKEVKLFLYILDDVSRLISNHHYHDCQANVERVNNCQLMRP